ncbi:MAG: PD-(D/E)XK nuclease-like domain-containing protein [Alphaproteobacteria bacterium]|nr:PD-(D/E)XK nuclease-like domain-containing protein [Alphaproteobacteria bacterium]
MTPGIYQISSEQYHHAPECDALSAGGIKSLLQSPAHFKASQENNGATPAMIFGSAAHSFILQPELGEVIALPADIDRRTKAGREAYEVFMTDARRFARIVISQDELATLHEMREMLLQHEKARLLLKGGKAELSIFWNHPEYGYLCKCRPDYLREDLKVIVDYKTCIDASPEGFGRAVYNFRYHNQAEWYRRGLKAQTGDDYEFVFVAQEKTPPYAVGVYRTTPEIFEIGKKENDRACWTYFECLESGIWCGYPDRIFELELPGWAYK